MLALLLLAALQTAPAASIPAAPSDPLAPLSAYNGSWTIISPHTLAGPGKPDILVNHCTHHIAFFTCEQVVNGKPLALMVFVPTDKPNQFHTQPIFPNGQAVGRGDLTLDGPHWTFSSKDVEPGKTTWYRTENFFKGPNAIHFDQYESADGTTWTKTSEGDETRNPS